MLTMPLCLAQALSLIVLIWMRYYPFRKAMWRIRFSGIGLKQADWLILREFREDLLREEHPVTSLGRITTNWVVRLGRFLPI